MQITTVKLRRYRRSLSDFMGYALEQDVPIWQSLARLLMNDQEMLDDFLTRYPRGDRERRRGEVKYVIAHWLAELASTEN